MKIDDVRCGADDIKCWDILKRKINLKKTYPWSILSIGWGPPIMWPDGPICVIGCPWPNGEFDGIPNCGPVKLFGDGKWDGPKAGPELPGRPNGGAFDGEPNGPLVFGPLYCCDAAEFGGGGKPALLTFCGGAGPGVDEPDGAGDAVYCGVFEPVGGPPWNCTGWPLPAGLPWPAFGNTGPPNEFGPLCANPPGPLPWLSDTFPPGPVFHAALASSKFGGKPIDGGGAFRLPNPTHKQWVRSVLHMQS